MSSSKGGLAASSSPSSRLSGDSTGTCGEGTDRQQLLEGCWHESDPSGAAPFIPRSAYQNHSSRLSVTMEKYNSSKASRFFDKIAVESEPGLTNAQLMLANHDLKPVEPERRQWRGRNFVAFWIADSFNINTWMISSAAILNGLSWWQSWITVWVGYSIAACFICLTGRIGATYHISFPVVARSSFGIWGSLWPVLNRAAMACIWYGVQAWIGGTCVYLMIRSIWTAWDEYGDGAPRNTMPVSSGTNTRDFVSFFLFWLGSLPFLWFPVHKIRHLFTVKAYFVPTAGIAFFVSAQLLNALCVHLQCSTDMGYCTSTWHWTDRSSAFYSVRILSSRTLPTRSLDQ